MNWYFLYKFAFRNPNDMDSIVICKEILEIIRNLYQTGKLNNQTISYKIASNKLKNKDISDVLINLTIENANYVSDGFDIAGYFAEDNTIEIILTIFNNFSNKQFEVLYYRLFDVVRHEIQHFINFKTGNKTAPIPQNKQGNLVERIRAISDYILSERELIPYIRGMMLRAKRQRIPFRDIVLDMIDRSFYRGSIDYKNKLKLLPMYRQLNEIENSTMSKIIEKASQIYPNLKENK